MPLVAHEDCVLVVVDAQPGFVCEGDALERAVWLVSVARALGVPVVATEEEPAVNGATDPRFGVTALLKPTFGLAGTPEILRAIRATERRTAVLVGYETDVCVLQSAIGLQDEGFRVLIVEDAVDAPGEMHARGLERAREAGIGLTHCKALAYQWVRRVDRLAVLPRPAPFGL
jgi:nicotinamidase-related amidase